jgi:hypothetical protein
METETKKMYRPVLERIVMAHFNNELIAYVNTGIDPGWGKGSVGQLSVRVVGVWETPRRIGRLALFSFWGERRTRQRQ